MPEHSVYRGEGTADEFNVHIVVGGSGYVELGGKARRLVRGEAFLFFPFEEQRYYSSKDDPWHVLWVHFQGFRLKEFLVEHGFHRSTLWTLHQLSAVEEAHAALYDEARRHRLLHETKLSGLTYLFLTEMMAHAALATDQRPNASMDRIHELLPRMQETAAEPFDLERWAGQAGVSTYYFCKLFRKATGLTPLAFITMCRLQQGKQWLLDDPDKPIREIAEEVGYASASYFNKKFMEQEGMTPSAFREQYRWRNG